MTTAIFYQGKLVGLATEDFSCFKVIDPNLFTDHQKDNEMEIGLFFLRKGKFNAAGNFEIDKTAPVLLNFVRYYSKRDVAHKTADALIKLIAISLTSDKFDLGHMRPLKLVGSSHF